MFFSEKPDLSFPFDALYYDPSLMKKVIADADFELTQAEKDEIEVWLDAQLALPLLINGVDAEGNYLEGAPREQIVREVSTPPPDPTGWRFDFEAAEDGGDHWVQV
jgi:hypothetical protein